MASGGGLLVSGVRLRYRHDIGLAAIPGAEFVNPPVRSMRCLRVVSDVSTVVSGIGTNRAGPRHPPPSS